MYRSAFEWSRMGYSIIKGQRSHRRTCFGVPLFSRYQVRDRRRAVLVREVTYRYRYL